MPTTAFDAENLIQMFASASAECSHVTRRSARSTTPTIAVIWKRLLRSLFCSQC